MSFRAALRNYVLAKPEDLGSDVLLSESETCITIFDKFPKAKFHFLVLPKLNENISAKNTTNLSTLLRWDKNAALELLGHMQHEAEVTKLMIEDEMLKRHGFKWDVWIGFHAVPSMDHVHLHVLSSDLCSPVLKKKQHYNSFRPDLGFFLHLEDVLKWFELPTATPFSKGSTFETKATIPDKKYDPLLKSELECFRCQEAFKTIPQLKQHLQSEWDKLEHKHSIRRKRSRTGSAEVEPGETASCS